MNDYGIRFVPKDDNPASVPQARPIEDYFWVLADRVQKKGWVAKDIETLVGRIFQCIRAIPDKTVQRIMKAVNRQLSKIYMMDVLEPCH